MRTHPHTDERAHTHTHTQALAAVPCQNDSCAVQQAAINFYTHAHMPSSPEAIGCAALIAKHSAVLAGEGPAFDIANTLKIQRVRACSTSSCPPMHNLQTVPVPTEPRF